MTGVDLGDLTEDEHIAATMAVQEMRLRETERVPQFWYYRPFSYRRWLPVSRGRDEFGRLTVVVGVPLTGHVVVPVEH